LLPYKSLKNEWILHLTMRCNYKCSYCIQKQIIKKETKRDYRPINEIKEEWFNLVGIKNKPFKVVVMGGEPSLHPLFEDILIALIKDGYNLDCTTNLSFNVDGFVKKMQDEKVVVPSMWVTFHPENINFDDFADKISLLGGSGVVGRLTAMYMDLEDQEHLKTKKYIEGMNEFYAKRDKIGCHIVHGYMRGQHSGEAFRRERNKDGSKATRPILCTSSWVNIAPDGEIYNCAYHMSLGKNSFGNISDIKNIRRMPEFGEYFRCDDFGWCEACHTQSDHGGYKEIT